MAGFWKRFLADRGPEVDALLAQTADQAAAGDGAGALATLERAGALAPKRADVSQMRGRLLANLGRLPDALRVLRDALDLHPGNSSLHVDCGNALRLSGDHDGAEIEYRRALGLERTSVYAHKALGSLLLELQRPAEAAEALDAALRLAPADVEATSWRALAAFRTFDYAMACDLYARLNEQGLLDLDGRHCLGLALLQSGRVAQAIQILEAARESAPPDSTLHRMITLNLAYCHLTGGDWSKGFSLHERRHDVAPKPGPDKELLDFVSTALAAIPRWMERGGVGKRLLVWKEQGHGDAIMLMRLLPVLLEEWQAAEVTFLCPPSLAALASSFDGVRFLVAEPGWYASAEQYDAHCSIMSLPYLMGITCDAPIPGRVPYIRTTASQRDHWQDVMAPLSGLKVGIAWAGNPNLPQDALRSIALAHLQPLLSVDGVSMVSLQRDDAAREELHVSGMAMFDWMDRCRDFADTAALIEHLDLVVSVDTAVAHLAGALGKPVWLLNRYESEWRWLRDRDDTPWYPTMRIFNQTAPRNWTPLIDRVVRELQILAADGVRGPIP